MKIVFCVLILLTIAGCVDKSQDGVDWKRLESAVANSEKRKLLGGVDDPIVESFEQMVAESGDDRIFDSFHVVDLNGDGKSDIIYNGYGGAADEFIMIFINGNGRLKKSFHTYGQIRKIDLNSKVTVLEVFRPLFVSEEGLDSTIVYKISEMSDQVVKDGSFPVKP
jgi:hypothetical protein